MMTRHAETPYDFTPYDSYPYPPVASGAAGDHCCMSTDFCSQLRAGNRTV